VQKQMGLGCWTWLPGLMLQSNREAGPSVGQTLESSRYHPSETVHRVSQDEDDIGMLAYRLVYDQRPARRVGCRCCSSVSRITQLPFRLPKMDCASHIHSAPPCGIRRFSPVMRTNVSVAPNPWALGSAAWRCALQTLHAVVSKKGSGSGLGKGPPGDPASAACQRLSRGDFASLRTRATRRYLARQSHSNSPPAHLRARRFRLAG
jgi:hypothetical protein